MGSRSAWLSRLAALSPTVSKVVKCTRLPDVDYSYSTPAGIGINNADAYNFCCDESHNIALARCLESLSTKGRDVILIEKYLTDLTGGRQTQTCGTLCELLVYDWLDRNGLSFEAQITVNGTEILNPSGSDLDGKLTVSSDVYFDVKTFGFQETMIARLKARLEADLPDSWIAIEGSWDVSAEMIQDLLEPIEYSKLRTDLATTAVVRRGILEFIRRTPKPLQVSSRWSDPYAMAEEHASYVFRHAKQFARHKPFILFLAHHPWLGGLSLNTDFASATSTYMRAMARRTFMQFRADLSPVFDVTKGVASRLISGIGFLNISNIPPQLGEQSNSPQHQLRLFVNPNATNPIPRLAIDMIKRLSQPGSVLVEDFAHDNY
jgi:hypothetical protein